VRPEGEGGEGGADEPSREGTYTEIDGVLVQSGWRFLTAVLEFAHCLHSSFNQCR
jgi:hypothetical protein